MQVTMLDEQCECPSCECGHVQCVHVQGPGGIMLYCCERECPCSRFVQDIGVEDGDDGND